MIITTTEAERIMSAINITLKHTFQGSPMLAEQISRGIFLEFCKDNIIEALAQEFTISIESEEK